MSIQFPDAYPFLAAEGFVAEGDNGETAESAIIAIRTNGGPTFGVILSASEIDELVAELERTRAKLGS